MRNFSFFFLFLIIYYLNLSGYLLFFFNFVNCLWVHFIFEGLICRYSFPLHGVYDSYVFLIVQFVELFLVLPDLFCWVEVEIVFYGRFFLIRNILLIGRV